MILGETLLINQQSGPQWTGLRYMIEDPELREAVVINYAYNGSQFSVFTCTDDTPEGSGLGQSDEGKILNELHELSWGEESEEKDIQTVAIQGKLAGLVGEACFPLMQKLAPLSTPEPRTLQERIYPLTYALRVFSEDGKLTSQELVNLKFPAKYPPIAEAKLQEMGLDDTVPVFNPSEIVLGERLQSLVWKVTVDGKDMICKIAVDVFGDSVSGELETYLRIQRAGIRDSLKVPRLQGVIRSHTGVIGILLNFIPNKHHSLRVLLKLVEEGSVPETEASTSPKQKWAAQIKHCLAQLHELGIMWRDVKSDNVLIDENNDAVLLDFGGGNTVGWVDRDKYGTMEGSSKDFKKILKALGEE